MKESVMKAASTLIFVLLVPSLAACGSGSVPGAGGIAGMYVLDVDRTVASSGGASEEAAAAMREHLGPETYRVDLRSDGTFTLDVSLGQDTLTVGGSWGEGTDGSWIKTETVNGEAPQEGVPVTSALEVEPGFVVLEEGGQRIYLRKAQ